MSQQELLSQVVRALDANKIDYMITGSIASSLQGEPRSSHDIDIVLSLDPTAANALIKSFPPPEYYLSQPAVQEAIENNSMFNLIRIDEGDKVDFWLLTDDRFDQSRFARKAVNDLSGLRLKVSAPEDTILAKLRWSALCGGSEKQFNDALRVYEVQFNHLDLEYLSHWAQELDVEPLLQRLRQEAQTL